MKTTVIKFDVLKAIEHSWRVLWESRLNRRNDDYRGDSYYLTASDLVNQVRACAQAEYDGELWPTEPRNYYGAGQYGWRLKGANIMDCVRSWLATNSQLQRHNFGRGHISGMRYRPVGEPLSPAEQKTLAKKEQRRLNPRPSPRHYKNGGPMLCRKNQKPSFWGRSKAWTTTDKTKVTCPRCAKLLMEAQ